MHDASNAMLKKRHIALAGIGSTSDSAIEKAKPFVMLFEFLIKSDVVYNSANTELVMTSYSLHG